MSDEYQRLLAVNRFKHISAGVTHDLDDIANLVSQICEIPVVLITIMDEHMQWFKAKRGTEIDCNDRDSSFCNITITQTGLLEVRDAQVDERFKQLPIVLHEPHVRFYAGIPLLTFDGHAIGTLCVIDLKPRELTEIQKGTLKVLAKQVLNILELNWSLQSLAKQHEEAEKQKYHIEQYALKLNAVFNSSKDIHLLLGKNFEILAFNRSASVYAEDNYNILLEYGKSFLDYLPPKTASRFPVYFNSALSGVTHETEWDYYLNGELRWMQVSFTAARNDDRDVIGVAVDAADITQNKRREAQVSSQNTALQRIATFQSHELRRPVASLMGIMELIKDEPLLNEHPYTEMMSTAVLELDQKIRGIVKDAESTIYGDGASE